MIRILTGVKVRHAACGAILRQITASKGSKGELKAGGSYRAYLWAHNAHMWALWAAGRRRFASGAHGRCGNGRERARRAPSPRTGNARPWRRSLPKMGRAAAPNKSQKKVRKHFGSCWEPTGGRRLAAADGSKGSKGWIDPSRVGLAADTTWTHLAVGGSGALNGREHAMWSCVCVASCCSAPRSPPDSPLPSSTAPLSAASSEPVET